MSDGIDSQRDRRDDEVAITPSPLPDYEGYVGNSPSLLDCLTRAAAVAPLTVPIMIYGATGTGKRNLAKAIHRRSGRIGPLIHVDCSHIPQGLMASALFGHEKGVFTGAGAARLGFIESANSGTLLLDEVENLSSEVQEMLLVATDSKSARMRSRRLGSTAYNDFDVRLVCATNIDLEKEVQQGRFRQDLYYRLNVFPLAIPALHDRGEEYLRGLIEYLLKEIQRDNPLLGEAADQLDIDTELLQKMTRYSWPGNVRELSNVLLGAAVNALRVRGSSTIQDADLPPTLLMKMDLLGHEIVFKEGLVTPDILDSGGGIVPWDKLKDAFLTRYLKILLKVTGGNKSEVSKLAGIDKTTLYRHLRRLGLQ